jgi:hypothetical protein
VDGPALRGRSCYLEDRGRGLSALRLIGMELFRRRIDHAEQPPYGLHKIGIGGDRPSFGMPASMKAPSEAAAELTAPCLGILVASTLRVPAAATLGVTFLEAAPSNG